MANDVVDVEVVEEEKTQELVRVPDERSVDELVAHVGKIKAAMSQAMVDGEHYGVIPGTKKPTLLKPGAEMLCVLFRLGPEPESVQEWDGKHLTITTKMTLRHIPTGNFVGAASGMCSTREKGYAERMSERVCPSCGASAIIKGKQEFGGGWVCFKKKGGCGAKYADGDAAIEDQTVSVVENPDLPDVYNTILKMSEKRALVAAVLNATAASQVFTQDLDDRPAPAPAATAPVVEDALASDDEKMILAGLYQQKKPDGTLEEGLEWIASFKAKGDSRAWVAKQCLNLLLRPDPPRPSLSPEAAADMMPNHLGGSTGLERLGSEPELPVEPIPGQTVIEVEDAALDGSDDENTPPF